MARTPKSTKSKTRAKRRRHRVKWLAEGQVLTLEERRIPVVFQKNTRAHRIILRFDQSAGRVVIVLPERASLAEGRRFALSNKQWIRERLDLLPAGIPFAPGRAIPFMGAKHRIRHRPHARGVVWCADGEINVAGRAEHLPRRVEDWLKLEARRELAELAHEKAKAIGKKVRRVRLRDPKTRWASCTHDGELAFSWRIILAPKPIIDYIVAHEVAHLREMNHGPRFWKLVGQLTRNVDSARDWLARHGLELHRYGRGEAAAAA